MSEVSRRVAFFFLLLTVFYLPYFVSHGDRVLSEFAVTQCGYHESNPLGLWPETFVVVLDVIVGGMGVIGFLSLDRSPRLAMLLIFAWSLYVFVFGLALHDNILKLAYGGCAGG